MAYALHRTITREKFSPANLALYVVIASIALLFTVYEIKAITSETVIDISDARGTSHYMMGSCAEGTDNSGLCGKRVYSLGE